jgi:chemotaxis protein methyltransferase CheR
VADRRTRISSPRLELEELRQIGDLVKNFCGIKVADDAREAVERRLSERLDELKLASFAEYHRYMRENANGRSEIERASELLATNETYFFRELPQLRAFEREVLPELAKLTQIRKTLTIWSAGCSTGEEVYTLAILIVRSGLFPDHNVRVFGNDISRRVLLTARKGLYRSGSFRAMPKEYDQHFIKTPEGRVVEPAIRALCHFGHFNVLDASRAAVVGRVDAIFCRNVLIYFDDEARRKAIAAFYERLHSGGYLMLGHSESLLSSVTSFQPQQLSGDLVYRKSLLASARPRSR